MKTNKVLLRSAGGITQIPDSQKLFGALMYLYAEDRGSEKATALAQAVLHNELEISLSNVMPDGYLPTPQDYLIDKLWERPDTQESLKQKRKAIKDRSYITLAELRKIWDAPEEAEDLFPYVKLEDFQQLRASIQSDQYGMPGLESNLYSVPTVVPIKIDSKQDYENPNSKKNVVRDFSFYLCVDDNADADDFAETINKAAEKKRIVILGKRASQGLNLFELQSFSPEKFTFDQTNVFLNTGMLLPNDIDFGESTIKLFTSERRPFEMQGGWTDDFAKQFISFIAEGSIIYTHNDYKKIGKSIVSPFDTKSIVFGKAFMYPLSF